MRTNRSQGFTLVELMIVVAIIGILAAVAIPSFVNYQLTAKRAEGFANLAAIATAQRAYFAEFNQFVYVAAEPLLTVGVAGAKKRSSIPVAAAFAEVGWEPEGNVYFDYDSEVGRAPVLGSCTCTSGCFTASAYGDLDGDGNFSVLIFAHPDPVGGFCSTGLVAGSGPFLPSLAADGSFMLDEVSRVVAAARY